MVEVRKFLSACAPAFVHDWRRTQAERRLVAKMQPFARRIVEMDAANESHPDSSPEACIRLGLDWLLRAQKHSASDDGGVARHFSLIHGWAASYPETTGYIVPTLIREAKCTQDDRLLDGARRMLDWLVSIQFPQGGFQGGVVGELPRVPVTFNTGQVLLGLATGAEHFRKPEYLQAMKQAADWLVNTQDEDGGWRRFPTPFADPGEKAYETHVAWALFEADRVVPDRGYGEAGMRQVRWALKLQRDNGWFEKCCLSDEAQPLTHTIGYVLRGVIEAYRWRRSGDLLAACENTAAHLLRCMREDGYIPARLDCEWRPAASFACLTGLAQIAICWLMLHEYTGRPEYAAAGRAANRFVRGTILRNVHPGVDGGVRGSYPVTGDYGRYEFLNWAVKFMIDANRREVQLG